MDVDVIIFLILAFVVLFCFTVFMVLSYSGLFVEPQVRTGEPPWSKKSVTIAYKYMKGPYNSNDVGATFTEVTSIAPKALCLGIFYDDPHTVQPDRLRSIVGCIVKENVNETEEKILIEDYEMKVLSDKNFKLHKLPEIDMAVLSEFPYTTPFSIWLAPNRVYPRFNYYISSRGLCAYPMIEVYKDCKILYAAPLSKQEDFFVPESLEEQPAEDAESAESAAERTPDDESPNLHAVGRNAVVVVDGKNEEEREISTISSLNDENNLEENRSSRSGSNSSSFEEIEKEDLAGSPTSPSSKKND